MLGSAEGLDSDGWTRSVSGLGAFGWCLYSDPSLMSYTGLEDGEGASAAGGAGPAGSATGEGAVIGGLTEGGVAGAAETEMEGTLVASE